MQKTKRTTDLPDTMDIVDELSDADTELADVAEGVTEARTLCGLSDATDTAEELWDSAANPDDEDPSLLPPNSDVPEIG